MNLRETIINGTQEERDHEKDSFWASESEMNVFDIYHRWKGTEETNPPSEQGSMIMLAGKMIEEAVLEKLMKNMAIESQVRVEMERQGVKVTGYMDGIILEEVPKCEQVDGEQYYDKDGKEI